eukprot:6192129-Pleurochrysis_carterae.AAC.3
MAPPTILSVEMLYLQVELRKDKYTAAKARPLLPAAPVLVEAQSTIVSRSQIRNCQSLPERGFRIVRGMNNIGGTDTRDAKLSSLIREIHPRERVLLHQPVHRICTCKHLNF